MKLEMIGLNHTTSVLATRDRAAIGPDKLPHVARRLLREPEMEGVIVLSTCNRVEVYFSPVFHKPDEILRALLAEVCELTSEEARVAYIYRDAEAAAHLFRVASGLDSQLLGEVQILVQVKQAYHTALELACSNPFLNKLIMNAIECGKSVRHKTAISEGAASVSSAAVEVAGRVFGKLSGRHVLLVGAGETVQLAAKYLADASVTNWRISNRTRENAQKLADTLNGEVVAFPPRAEDIEWADIVLCATSAPQTVIANDTIAHALSRRKESLLLLDLAVPRDIESLPSGLSDVFLFTVDDFHKLVKANLQARESEAARAEILVKKSVADFVEWHRENRISPSIRQLQEVLESIRNAEVENSAKRFRPEDLEKVDRFSKALMNKVSSLIINNMKRASLDRDDLSLARAVSMAVTSTDEATLNEVLEKLNHELSH
jgi:glutamyl-tRNA reductase